MKLPNGERAVVDLRKLRDYCLNPDNPRGSGKARVFAAALGITASNPDVLKRALLKAARDGEVVAGEKDEYGQRYSLSFELATLVGSATIKSAWIVLHGEDRPRLATCYIPKRKRARK